MGNTESSEQTSIEEMMAGDPFLADIVIDMIQSEHSAPAAAAPATAAPATAAAAKENDDTKEFVSSEQFMKIQIQLPELDKFCMQERTTTQLILVADRSGSMAGNPWKQVQNSLVEIIKSNMNNAQISISLIVYNSAAKEVNFNHENYESIISAISCGSTTSFKDAFDCVDTVMQRRRGEGFSKVVIVFLTDGEDTVSGNANLGNIADQWKVKLRQYGDGVCIHTVGFSRSHDLNFMKKLTTLGGKEGMYRYCEPQDGSTALREKLDDLFDFITFSSGQKVDVEVNLHGDDKLIGLGNLSSQTILEGEIIDDDTNEKCKVVNAETWIYLSDPESVPEVSITVKKTLKQKGSTREICVPCIINNVKKVIVDEPEDKVMWSLRILSRNTDILTTKFAATVEAKGDVSKLESRLSKLQHRVSNIQVFGHGISKDLRPTILEIIEKTQEKINLMHSMLANYVRGETQSVSMLAKAHDLRYAANFSKSRRQRLMDKRATKNMRHAKTAQDQLQTLTVDEDDLKRLSQDALEFYFCPLSQNSVTDLMSGDDKNDAMGFGLAVKRPEFALDEPTAIRIYVISGTVVSRSAMLDALEYKIKVDGHLEAHGGFTFDYESDLGVTTVGMGREPINAWLPLYVTKAHWDRVKILLKPSLGSFCTLDPLGYDYKQIDVMFMILGQMIGQLNNKTVGEHQLKMVFAFIRTCSACIEDFALTEEVTNVIKKFIEGPAGRTKDIIPNLFTLMGYIVTLPVSISRDLFNTSSGSSRLNEFFIGLLAENTRRAAGRLYRDTSDTIINGLTNTLLGGKGEEEVKLIANSGVKARLVNSCQEVQKDVTIKPYSFDAGAGLCPPQMELKHSAKIDKAMEIWAQAQCGVIKNKNRAEQVAEAKKVVEKWIKDGERMAKGEVEVTEKETEQMQSENDLQMTEEAFDLMVKLHQKLLMSSHPGYTHMPALFAFIEFWLAVGPDFRDIDANSGIAPESWIDEVKKRIIAAYCNIEAFTKKCKTDTEGENTDNTFVVVAMDVDTPANTSERSDSRSAQPANQRGGPSKQNTNNKDSMQVEDITDLSELELCDTGSDNVTEQQTAVSPDSTVEITETESMVVVDNSAQSTATETQQPDSGTNQNEPSFDYMDDDYGDDDDNDYEEEYDPAQYHKKNKPVHQRITLPALLNMLNGDLDMSAHMRAILCEAVNFHSNSKARTAAQNGYLKDLGDTASDNAVAVLKLLKGELQKKQDGAVQNNIDQAIWTRANYCMIQATSEWAFIGYLMCTHKDRLEGFSQLIHLFLDHNMPETIPCLKEKIKILITGKYDDHSVLANGNMWWPDKKSSQKFSKLIGEEAWDDIDLQLRSNVQIHVYRESDIPNRHGHCNSNPYIPNNLRMKLGMTLLPEPKGRPPRRHIKSKLTS